MARIDPEQAPTVERASSDEEAGLLPPVVGVDSHAMFIEYWRLRERQHVRDVYAGVRIKKFPEDLRVLEHVMWLSRAQIVVELGTHFGGATLWFRDRLRTMAAYGRVPAPIKVISIDLAQDRAHTVLAAADPDFDQDITLVAGDITDPSLADRVASLVPPEARCMVVEDTMHEYNTTMAALRNFSDLVPEGGFFIVEDGIVDMPELRPPGMPGGVLPALRDWLNTEQGNAFQTRRDLELYGLTNHPHGWLQRRRR